MNLVKTKIGCSILFICGVALCIGGIWFPPLIPLGVVFVAGSLGMLAQSLSRADDEPARPIERKPAFIITEHESWIDSNKHHHITERVSHADNMDALEFKTAEDSLGDEEPRHPRP